MKRALLALFAFLLLTMPRAANAQVYGDFFYSSDGSAITITGYGGDGGQATIPDTIEDLPVTAIAEYAFIATSLTSLTLPGSVTSIGDEAFADCSSLTSLYFEGNAPACSWFAFEACPAVAYYQLGTTGWRTFTT